MSIGNSESATDRSSAGTGASSASTSTRPHHTDLDDRELDPVRYTRVIGEQHHDPLVDGMVYAPGFEGPMEVIADVDRRRPSISSLATIVSQLQNGETTVADLDRQGLAVDDWSAVPDGERRAANWLIKQYDLDLVVDDGLSGDIECEHDPDDAYLHVPDSHGNSRFCSLRCACRARATAVLDMFTQDHKFCANCFRLQKRIEGPRQHWGPDADEIKQKWRTYGDQEVTKQAFVGKAYPTEHTEHGIRTHYGRAPEVLDQRFAPRGIDRTGNVCECGVCSHRNREWPLSKGDAIEAAQHLADNLQRVREEWACGSERQYQRARQWAFSRELLLFALGELKSDPSRRFDDRRLFTTAIAAAIRDPDRTI